MKDTLFYLAIITAASLFVLLKTCDSQPVWVGTKKNSDGVLCSWIPTNEQKNGVQWKCPLTKKELNQPVSKAALNSFLGSEKYRLVMADPTAQIEIRKYLDDAKKDGEISISEFSALEKRLAGLSVDVAERSR